MKKLEEKEWNPFSIVKQFRTIQAGKISAVSQLHKAKNGFNYIGATNKNNGVISTIKINSDLSKLIQKGNTIGFIKDGDGSAGYAIYKKEAFVSTVNVLYGYSDWLNTFTGLFFVTAQDMIESKYSHGYKRNRQHLSGDKVMLPTNQLGKPDYDYMEQYITNIKNELLNKYKTYAQQQLDKITYIDIPTLEEKEWSVFFIGDLFKIKRPVARSKDNYHKGSVPFVASGNFNNGVVKLVLPKINEVLDHKNSITVSPVDGSSFYQPTNFLGRGGAGSSILILINQKINKFSGIFLAKTINHTCSKYSYGHMGNKDSIKRERILLPVTSSMELDFDYMEQYIKNLMFKKYNQYLTYINKSN